MSTTTSTAAALANFSANACFSRVVFSISREIASRNLLALRCRLKDNWNSLPYNKKDWMQHTPQERMTEGLPKEDVSLTRHSNTEKGSAPVFLSLTRMTDPAFTTVVPLCLTCLVMSYPSPIMLYSDMIWHTKHWRKVITHDKEIVADIFISKYLCFDN